MYRFDSLATLRNYYPWILEEFRPFLGRRILEVGAGIGTFSHELLQSPGVECLSLLEPLPEAYVHLAERFRGEPRITCHQGRAEQLRSADLTAEGIDTVVMVNVLEHIEDDGGLLATFAAGLPRGGRVLLFLPAFPLLYGHIDASAGHYRRYTRPGTVGLLEAAGFQVRHARYFNCIGFFSWLLLVRLLKADDFDPRGLRLMDSLIPFLKRAERLLPPPFGQNLLIVGEVPV